MVQFAMVCRYIDIRMLEVLQNVLPLCLKMNDFSKTDGTVFNFVV